jgi:UDP-glucose 4-epimerase
MTIAGTFRDKKILVTGAAGFIGGHVAAAFFNLPCRLALLDAANPLPSSNERTIADVSRHSMSILDQDFLAFLVDQRFDYVFHFAGNANVATSVSRPDHDFEVNVRASLSILEAIRTAACDTVLLYASSAAVYGNPTRLPIAESDATVPISPYGVGKLAMERYLSVYCRLYGLRGVSVRMFSPFGPGLRKQIVFELMQRIRCHPDALEVYGDGSQTRDFIYIDDVVSAILRVATHGSLDGTTYNIGRGVETPVSEVVHQLIALMSPTLKVKYRGESMPGYPDNWRADIGLTTALGWAPTVSLEEGLRRTVAWHDHAYPEH